MSLIHVRLFAAAAAVVALSACASSKPSASGTPSSAAPTGSTTSTGSVPASSTAASTSGSSDNPLGDSYYPYVEGNTWVYKTDYGSSSIGIVDYTEKVTKVESSGSDKTATVSRSFHYESGRTKDFEMTLKYVIHSDGTIDTPYQPTQVAGVTSTIKTGHIELPSTADLESGKPVTSHVEVTISRAGTSYDSKVDSTIQGKGHESVTVPAGKYDAIKADNTIKLTISIAPTSPTTTNTTVYLVKGIGMVKSIVKGSTLPTGGTSADISTVLVSFTHS